MKKHKKARLDALEAAYLSLREDHVKLRSFANGIFDLVTQCHESLERVEKWVDVHGRANDLEAKGIRNTLANLDFRIRAAAAERTELCNQKISTWERQAIGDPPPGHEPIWGDSEVTTHDIPEQRRINEELKRETDWIEKHMANAVPAEKPWSAATDPIPGRYK